MLLVGMVLLAGILYVLVDEARYEEDNLELEQGRLKREIKRSSDIEKSLQIMVGQRKEERGIYIASQLNYPVTESLALGGGSGSIEDSVSGSPATARKKRSSATEHLTQ